MSDKLFIVVPAYNEQENITELVESWYPVVLEHGGEDQGSRLLIVDDGSRDDTWKILRELAAERPCMTVLTKENEGHGPTLIYGYQYALDHQADYIFQTDADGQTSAAEFEPFWDQRGDYDAVIGIRKERMDGAGRVFVEQVLCQILRLVFGIKVTDANAPYRLMTRVFLGRYLAKLPAGYTLPNVMLTTYAVYYKERTSFIPISFRPRAKGKNSIHPGKIIRIGIRSLRDFWSLKKDMR